MIRALLLFSLRNRWLTVAMALVVMGIGWACFRALRIEAYPDIADTNVIVVAVYEGRAAEEVEQQVTIPIERALRNTPRVLDRRSRTIFGLSVVQLTFEDGTDDYFARQQVIERLAAAELPEGVAPELAPLSTAVGEIFRYAVEAPPTVDPTTLRDLQDWVVRPALLEVPGVADVVTFGGPLKQFHVLVSPDRLRALDLTLADIEDAIRAANRNTGGGLIRRGEQGLAVRGIGLLRDADDIRRIVLRSAGGVPLLLGDVASVETGPPPPSGVLGYSVPAEGIEVRSGVEGIVLLRRHENPSEVLEALRARIALLQERQLPAGVTVRSLYDRGFLIGHSLSTVGRTLFEGVSIVVILLVFFLGSVRSAVITALTIPFALLFAFILMRLTGMPANLLSLGAIDFGIIVDGAVVMVEHLVRTYRTAPPDEKRGGIVRLTLRSAQEVGREIFFSVTIIVLAYLPILLMTRVEGKLFGPMALTLAFAVVGSMLAALTFIPVLVSFAFNKALADPDAPVKPHRNRLLEAAERGYGRLLGPVLRRPWRALAIGGGITAIGLALGLRLGTEFLPELDEGSIFLRINFPAGMSIQENARHAPEIRRIIASFPQVDYVITQTGRNDDGTDPFPANRNEVLVGLKDYHLWNDTITKAEVLKRMLAALERALPGARVSSGQPIIDQVMEIVTGSAADLAVSVVGDDLELLRAKADSIAAIMRGMEGSASVNIEQEGPQDQLAVRIDRAAAARYGVRVDDIQSMIEAAIGGREAGIVYDGAKRYSIVLRHLPEHRADIESVRRLLVPAPNGARVALEQLADINLVSGQTNIYRFGSARMVTVRTNIRGRDQGGFVRELKERIEEQVGIPRGYGVVYGGQFENLGRAAGRLALTIPLTLALVFSFLFMLYRSMRHTLITMACVLFAVAGGIGALLLRGYYFNVSAGVGFVSIFGISVMAGVLLVSAMRRAARAEGRVTRALVRRISLEQFRAVLSILVVAIVGLVPAALSTGIGSDVQRPLATVIIGGLTCTLLLAPLLIPPLFLVAGGGVEAEEERPSP
jgi:cobalt-zinc-cadmium resistance protein CzcA